MLLLSILLCVSLQILRSSLYILCVCLHVLIHNSSSLLFFPQLVLFPSILDSSTLSYLTSCYHIKSKNCVLIKSHHRGLTPLIQRIRLSCQSRYAPPCNLSSRYLTLLIILFLCHRCFLLYNLLTSQNIGSETADQVFFVKLVINTIVHTLPEVYKNLSLYLKPIIKD